jgi:hypothetical protein
LWKLSEFNIAEFVDSHFHLCWCSYHRNRVHDDALAAGTVDVDDNLVALYLKYYDWCHAPVLGYKENMNLSVKIHLNKGIFLLNLDFNLLFHYIYIYIYIFVILYNAINFKRKTYCTIQRLCQSPNDLLLLARSMPLPRSDFGLLCPKMVVRYGVSLTAQ